MRDLYNFYERFETAKSQLQKSKVIAKNKDLICRFTEYKQARGVGFTRCEVSLHFEEFRRRTIRKEEDKGKKKTTEERSTESHPVRDFEETQQRRHPEGICETRDRDPRFRIRLFAVVFDTNCRGNEK